MKAAIKYILIWLIVTVAVLLMVYTVVIIMLGAADVNSVGEVVKKRDEMHRIAQSNRAFAFFK